MDWCKLAFSLAIGVRTAVAALFLRLHVIVAGAMSASQALRNYLVGTGILRSHGRSVLSMMEAPPLVPLNFSLG